MEKIARPVGNFDEFLKFAKIPHGKGHFLHFRQFLHFQAVKNGENGENGSPRGAFWRI